MASVDVVVETAPSHMEEMTPAVALVVAAAPAVVVVVVVVEAVFALRLG